MRLLYVASAVLGLSKTIVPGTGTMRTLGPGLCPSKQPALTDAHALVLEMRSGTALSQKLIQGHVTPWWCPSVHHHTKPGELEILRVSHSPFFSLPQPTLPTAGD